MADGHTVIVERTALLGDPLDREPVDFGHPPPVVGHRIEIPMSNGKLKWEGDRSLVPLAIHVDGPTAFVVARPSTCPAYDRWDRPIPPYVVFRNDGTGWKRTTLDQIPSTVSRANLMIGTASKQAVELIERGSIDRRTIEQRNREVGLASETIYRTVTKEVRISFGACEGFQEAARNLPR
jgi:hypothetical protein